jgi:hypothetical protein
MVLPLVSKLLIPLRNTKRKQQASSVHMEYTMSESPALMEDGKETWQENSVSSDLPRDPRSWSERKKNTQILMVCFHAMSATFMVTGIIPAFEAMSEQYGVSLVHASYLVSAQVSFMLPNRFTPLDTLSDRVLTLHVY